MQLELPWTNTPEPEEGERLYWTEWMQLWATAFWKIEYPQPVEGATDGQTHTS